MTTVLNLPLVQAYPETIRELQETYPSANLRIEVRKNIAPNVLTEQRFWEIIQLFDWRDSEDNMQVLAPAIEALAASPVHHIYLFSDILASKLFTLDGRRFAEQIGDDAYSPNTYFSVDNFLMPDAASSLMGKNFTMQWY
jgi:hypothetical protein